MLVPWQQGATTNPEAFSIYLLPSPPGGARLRTDLVRIGLAYHLRALGRWDDAEPCNFNFSCPTRPTQPSPASEGQNLFALVIKVKLGTTARWTQPASAPRVRPES